MEQVIMKGLIIMEDNLPKKKEYEVWSEGFHVMEGRANAHFWGKVEAYSFGDACWTLMAMNAEFREYFDAKRMTHWGCRLFDNEVDARKSFG